MAKKKDIWLKGLKAVIVQHEIDHLNGILFTQRAVEQSMPLYEEKDDDLKKIDFT
jgi:peptide deformylase